MKIAPLYKWLHIKLTSSHYSGWFGVVSHTVFFPGSLFEGNGAKLNEIRFVFLLFVGMRNASRASITKLISITEGCWPQRSFLCCVLFTQVNFASFAWVLSFFYSFVSSMHHSTAVISFAWQERCLLKHNADRTVFFLERGVTREEIMCMGWLRNQETEIFFLCHWKILGGLADSSH